MANHQGQKELEITILNAEHLPKTDTFGACDPFFTIQFTGPLQKTSVKKRVYSAAWNEIFVFPITSAKSVIIDLFDWNLTSHAKIGTAVMPWEQVANISSEPIGTERMFSLNFTERGKEVTGNDKFATQLNIKLRILSSRNQPTVVGTREEENVRRRLG